MMTTRDYLKALQKAMKALGEAHGAYCDLENAADKESLRDDSRSTKIAGVSTLLARAEYVAKTDACVRCGGSGWIDISKGNACGECREGRVERARSKAQDDRSFRNAFTENRHGELA